VPARNLRKLSVTAGFTVPKGAVRSLISSAVELRLVGVERD
jgi:hypothetical protein